MIDSGDGGAKSTLYCSFCGKSQHEVRKLIAGPNVFICNECVELCADIIKEEDRKNRKAAGPSVMTPAEIMGVLDDYVIGQEQAKRVPRWRCTTITSAWRTAPRAARSSCRSRTSSWSGRPGAARGCWRRPWRARSMCRYHGRCHDADRGRLRRRGRREHHLEAVAGGRLQRRAGAARDRVHRRGRQDLAQV